MADSTALAQHGFPPVKRLAGSYFVADRYCFQPDGNVVEFGLADIRWVRCITFGFSLALSYAALVAISWKSNPKAAVHIFNFVLGLIIAFAPLIVAIVRQWQLRNHRPSIRLHLDSETAVLHGGKEGIPFSDITAICDYTLVDREGSVYSELQLLRRYDDSLRWILAGQSMGPASGMFHDVARQLSQDTGARHVTLDSRTTIVG